MHYVGISIYFRTLYYFNFVLFIPELAALLPEVGGTAS